MRVRPLGLGIIAPGLKDWSYATAVLRGDQHYEHETLQAPPPARLTPNERRRATLATKLALEAARQATAAAGLAGQDLGSVFASADGDMALIDSMCRAIYEHQQPPSPTVFQNSVHNAVAGYWSIATGCRQASTSVAAGDSSFAAGLLEAATQVACKRAAVLLVAFDVPAPILLSPHRPFSCAFACALLLAPAADGDEGATIKLNLDAAAAEQPETAMADEKLETLRIGNPAARALPLLAAIASARATPVLLPYWPELRLVADLEPAR
ncbi:MAG: beta-ketoacyl synthase chain length factor [Lamprobacter sp.]|uniref:beta-ketoacyl synthase chain length factor n=1 Tax=Lamprobacter sp. TaxID=3100796 RepID=UPI002B263DB3|nr:beta-ketoacyl synthase chain length factor [Lamprobacter sp.]MEA3640600.1 beta-ketoacyl synthase chain length factor [Lamprobacter sp.]